MLGLNIVVDVNMPDDSLAPSGRMEPVIWIIGGVYYVSPRTFRIIQDKMFKEQDIAKDQS